MQPTSAAWETLLAAFRTGAGVEALFAVVIPSRGLALTSRLWPPGVLPGSLLLYPYLAPTGQGIGQLSLELADDRSSRRGSVACQVATQAGQLGSVPGSLLTQLLSIGEQPAQVLGAFVGGMAHDQMDLRTLFTGRVTDLSLTRGTLRFTLVDGVDTDHRDIEIPVGATAFPGSPLDAHGQSIPLLIGTALGLQPLLVGGEAIATLATALPAAAVPTIDLAETAAAFPTNTTLLIESETLTYDGRRVGLLPDGTSTLQLLNPQRLAPVAHAAGTVVAIAPPIQYRYLVGIGLGTLELLAVRDQDGPIANFDFRTDFPGVPPGTGILNLSDPHDGVSVDVQVVPDPPPPALLNGGFESEALTPWVALPGTTAVVTAQDALAGNYKLELRSLIPSPRGVYQDVAVEVGKRYTVLTYWRTPAQTIVQEVDPDTGEPILDPDTDEPIEHDNTVDNGDFTDPTADIWEIDTGGMADIVPEYQPGRVDPAPPGDPGHPTVYNGAQTFPLPFAPFTEWVPDPVHPEAQYQKAAGYRSFNCLMSQPITVTPGQPLLIDVRVRAWNQSSSGIPTSAGMAGGSGGVAIQGLLPPLCEVQVEVTMSTTGGAGPGEYHHFLQPDQPRTSQGRMAEWRCQGGATSFTPSGNDYRFGINIFGRYIGSVPPIEVTSAVVVSAPTAALTRRAAATPRAAEDEAALRASGLVEIGTPADPTLYTTRLLHGPTTWQSLALSFVATETTTRISLLGQSAAAGAIVEYDGVRFLPAGRNPVRVMAGVFAQFLPHLTLSQTSVDTAATRRDGWLFSGYVPDPGRTDALLTKMSQECFCTLYKDVTGVYQIVADDYDMPVALSLSDTRDVHQGSTGLAWGAPQEVYTDFYLWYQRVSTQVTTTQAGQYAAVLYVTPDDSISVNPDLQTRCQQAQETLGTRRRFDYYADFIAEPVTADLLLTRLVQQYTLLAQALTVDASLAAVPVDVTDRMAVTTALLGPQPFVGEVRQTTLATSLQAPGFAVGLRVRQVGGARGVWEAWDSWSVEGVVETPGGVLVPGPGGMPIPGTTGPSGTTRVREAWDDEGSGPGPEPGGPWYLVGYNGPPLLVFYALLAVGPTQLDFAGGGREGDTISSQTGTPAYLFRNYNVDSGVPDEALHIAGGGLGAALGLYEGLAYAAIQPAQAPTLSQIWRLEPASSGPGTGSLAATLPNDTRVWSMAAHDFSDGRGSGLYLGTAPMAILYRWEPGESTPSVVLDDGASGRRVRSLARDPGTGAFWAATDNVAASGAGATVMYHVTATGFNRHTLPAPATQTCTMVAFGGTLWAATGVQDGSEISVWSITHGTGAAGRWDRRYTFTGLTNQQPGCLGVSGANLYLGRVSTTGTPMLELWRSGDGLTWALEVDFAPMLAGNGTPDTNTGITALALARNKFYAATGTPYAGPAPGSRWYCAPVPEGIV